VGDVPGVTGVGDSGIAVNSVAVRDAVQRAGYQFVGGATAGS
jgi:hypothetical protein